MKNPRAIVTPTLLVQGCVPWHSEEAIPLKKSIAVSGTASKLFHGYGWAHRLCAALKKTAAARVFCAGAGKS